MKKTRILLVIRAALLVFVLALPGCKKDEAAVGTPPPQAINTGNANFTRYVALGNSITAGYQSAALSSRDQAYSYPALLARHLSVADFQQPTIAEPGLGNRKRLVSLTGPVIIDETSVNPATANTNAALNRSYDNIGIPGAVLGDLLNTTNWAAQAAPPRNNPYFSVICRTATMNIVNQAKSRNPTFMTCWIGNNDVLGYATTGGVGAPITPTATFDLLYSLLLDSLKAIVDTNLVVANVPDVASIPFFTTVAPSIKAALPAGIQFRYQRGTNRGVSFDSTRFAETTQPLICLTGITYASYLGRTGGLGGGKYYSDNASSFPTLPAGIDTTKPFGFHPQNPWPTALALDNGEVATAQATITAYNASIATLAAARRIAVVDANAILRSAATAAGIYYAGYGSFTAAFIQGGLFGYDGVHPSSRGNVVIANEFIKVVNTKFKASIPLIAIAVAPGMQGVGNPKIVLSDYAKFGSFDFVNLMTGGQR